MLFVLLRGDRGDIISRRGGVMNKYSVIELRDCEIESVSGGDGVLAAVVYGVTFVGIGVVSYLCGRHDGALYRSIKKSN